MSSEAFLLQARRSGRDFTRERALPLQRLVPLLLNFRKGTNRDELDQFFETITDDPASVTPVSEAAFCRARQKLKPEALVTLNNVLLDSTNQQVVQQRWRGLRVLAVDGSTGRLPNLPAIEEYFGKPSGSGVPPGLRHLTWGRAGTCSENRREYIHVGSASASLPPMFSDQVPAPLFNSLRH